MTSRQARIQQLYDQIEPLWGRLQLDEDQMTLFTEMNQGCSENAIRAVRHLFRTAHTIKKRAVGAGPLRASWSRAGRCGTLENRHDKVGQS